MLSESQFSSLQHEITPTITDSGQMVRCPKMSASCVIIITPPEGTVSRTSQVETSFVSVATSALGRAGPDLGKLN